MQRQKYKKKEQSDILFFILSEDLKSDLKVLRM